MLAIDRADHRTRRIKEGPVLGTMLPVPATKATHALRSRE